MTYDSPTTPETFAAIHPRRASRLWIILPAAGASVVSAYLLYTAWLTAGEPIGCGAGSGCSEVLSSRWSQLFGMPVSLPATVLYVGVCLAAAAEWRRGLAFAAGALLVTMAWFIGLQGLVIGSWCRWCLLDHSLGLATCAAIGWTGRRASAWSWSLCGCGAAAGMLFAGLQIIGPDPRAVVGRLPERAVIALDGQLSLSLDDVPLIGSSTAQRHLIVLQDYCCPHCRHTHAALLEVLARHPDQFAAVLLPMPLNAECNRGVEETEPRFVDACELARLALAVWRADRARFPEFDRWLFDSERPRARDAARREASRLIGAAALESALRDPWVEERLAADVEAYIASDVKQLPVLLAPGRSALVGRAQDAAALEQLLRDELQLLE